MFKTVLRPIFALCFVWLSIAVHGQGAVLPIHLNYNSSEASENPGTYDYAPYRLNSHADSTALAMVSVVCDTFPDLLTGFTYSLTDFSVFRMDSIRIKLNHVNHSGSADTLIVGFAGTFNGVFPGENTYWRDTLIFTTSQAPGSTYASAAYLNIPVGFYLPYASFSLNLFYKGPAQDTLTLWSGYAYDGICEALPSQKRALLSAYYPNSFAYRKEFGQVLPAFNGDDIFFECDTVPGFDTLTDSRNYIQNWDMDIFLTTETASLSDMELVPFPELYPNPGTGYFQSSEPFLEINLLNMAGKTVWHTAEPGKSVYLPLAPGMYFAILKYATGTHLQKLIITR